MTQPRATPITNVGQWLRAALACHQLGHTDTRDSLFGTTADSQVPQTVAPHRTADSRPTPCRRQSPHTVPQTVAPHRAADSRPTPCRPTPCRRQSPHTVPQTVAPRRAAPRRAAPRRAAPRRAAPRRAAPHRAAPHRAAPHRAAGGIGIMTQLDFLVCYRRM